MKYKEKFDKEMKGKKPQFDLKESKIYKTMKDANDLASEVGNHRENIAPKISSLTRHVGITGTFEWLLVFEGLLLQWP